MYQLNAKSIPLNNEYEVIVVGGGPAGCTAAAAAAREGAKTLLIEVTSSLGGMGTSALVPAWTPFSDREKIIYKSLAERVFTETKKGMNHIKPEAVDWVAIDVERLKRVYDDLVTGFGAKILFNSFVCDVEATADGFLKTIIVANKSGLTAYQAKVFVDTTGDADLVAFSGSPFMKGDGSANPKLQPATHCFILSNVNTENLAKIGRLHADNPNSFVHRLLAEKKYPLIPDGHVIGTMVGPGTVGFNAGHVFQMDATKPETISQGLILGRKMAEEFRLAFKEYAPETFGDAHLVATGSLLGIRETRRIVGDYILTVDDYFERKVFDDEICRNSYFIDVHDNVYAAEAKGKLQRYKKGESHGIPYRSLIPVNLKNVLVAGRSISCERMVQGSVRVMPVCLAMGEGAGTAAGLAIRQGGIVRNIDINVLRQRLREEGAYIL
jgi:hypothetical protein